MTVFFWRTLILSLTVFVGALTLTACGDDDEASGSDGKVHAITTLPLFADFVREVGGDRVQVEALLPSGADPHTWEPSPQDVAKIEDADIAFANGLAVDTSALEIIEENVGDGVPVVKLGEETQNWLLFQSDEDFISIQRGKEPDPHLWMNVENGKHYATVIADSLLRVDLAGALPREFSSSSYEEDLDSLGEHMRGQIQDIPERNKKLITTHDAFGHLADYLGFELTAVVSESPGGDPSPDDIREIVEAVEDAGVPAVFSEPQTSGESDVLEQIAEDTGAEVCTLYSDAFEGEIDTYIEMMRFNADELARCLGGSE